MISLPVDIGLDIHTCRSIVLNGEIVTLKVDYVPSTHFKLSTRVYMRGTRDLLRSKAPLVNIPPEIIHDNGYLLVSVYLEFAEVTIACGLDIDVEVQVESVFDYDNDSLDAFIASRKLFPQANFKQFVLPLTVYQACAIDYSAVSVPGGGKNAILAIENIHPTGLAIDILDVEFLDGVSEYSIQLPSTLKFKEQLTIMHNLSDDRIMEVPCAVSWVCPEIAFPIRQMPCKSINAQQNIHPFRLTYQGPSRVKMNEEFTVSISVHNLFKTSEKITMFVDNVGVPLICLDQLMELPEIDSDSLRTIDLRMIALDVGLLSINSFEIRVSGLIYSMAERFQVFAEI